MVCGLSEVAMCSCGAAAGTFGGRGFCSSGFILCDGFLFLPVFRLGCLWTNVIFLNGRSIKRAIAIVKSTTKKAAFPCGKAADGMPQKLTFRDGLMPGLEGIAVDFRHGFAGGGYRCDIEQTAQRRRFAGEADEFFHVGFGVAQV